GPHVADARLGHPFPDQRLLLLGHHHMEMDGAAAFLCHRSSRSRLRQTRGGSFTLSSAFSRSGGWAGIGVLNTPESRRASWLAKSCSRFFSITVLLSVAPVRGFLLGAVRRSEEHTSELQSRFDLVCRLLLEKKKIKNQEEQLS